jgi:hypothetical protein
LAKGDGMNISINGVQISARDGNIEGDVDITGTILGNIDSTGNIKMEKR